MSEERKWYTVFSFDDAGEIKHRYSGASPLTDEEMRQCVRNAAGSNGVVHAMAHEGLHEDEPDAVPAFVSDGDDGVAP